MLGSSSFLPCPTLHVVVAEDSRSIETLPVGVWHMQHRVFISRGLLDCGVRPKELKALFARELAHIAMGHWHVPRAWTLLQASGVHRSVKTAWKHVPPEIERHIGQGWSQLQELCRAHAAITLAVTRVRLPPEVVDSLPKVGSHWLHWEAEYGDIITEVCELLEAPTSASVRAQTLWMLSRRLHVRLNKVQHRNHGSSVQTDTSFASSLVRALQGASRLHSPRGQGLLKSLSHGLSGLAHRPVLLLALAVKRTAELAADRVASEALGGIELVVAGLVRLHGSEEERQRLDRGDLQGIISGACAALSARGGLLRWELWWESLIAGPAEPPLILRMADLTAWAELGERGRLEPWRR